MRIESTKHRVSIFVIFIVMFVSSFCDENTKFSYENCPNGRELLNCSGVGFVQVPPDETRIPPDIQQLDLSNNQIQNISFVNYTITGTTLKILLLRNNRIAFLEDNGFKHLQNLEKLDLSKNNIMGVHLSEDAFNDLRSLNTLILERNPIGVIKKDTFNFMELPVLQNLDLSHCRLTFIEEQGLNIYRLEQLDLSWNQLEAFPVDSFDMLTELRLLDLSHNSFKVFDQVPYLPEIRTINLDSNFIQTVNISDKVWLMADSLERLYLRNNDMVRFSRDSIPWDLETLVEVRLENNRIQCDCEMRWFRLADYNFKNKTMSVPCQYPVELRGTNIFDVDLGVFTCSVPLSEILLLSGLSVMGIIVCLVSIYLICRRKCKQNLTRKTHKTKDKGGNYTAVFIRDDDDVQVSIGDDKSLIKNGREFDV